jgi:hypothetical protein
MFNCKYPCILYLVLSFYRFCSQVASLVPRLRVSRAAGGHAAAMPEFLVITTERKTRENLWKCMENEEKTIWEHESYQ